MAAKHHSVKCNCGYEFKISTRVIHRALSCPLCFRYYYYERSLDGKTHVEQIGAFKDEKELKTRTEAFGKELYGTTPKTNKR